MRLFVAVWPDGATLDLLSALPRPTPPGVRWTRPDQWHVTLRFLGEADPAAAGEALAPALREGSGALGAEMGPATALFGRNVLQVPVRGLEPLAARVGAATAAIGRPPRPGPFRGHLTLARGPGARPLRPLVGTPLASRWPVGEVTLVSSVAGPAGSAYEVVARWAIGA